MIRSTARSMRPRSTSRCTAAGSRSASLRRPSRASAICTRPICRRSRRWCRKAKSHRSWARTTACTANLHRPARCLLQKMLRQRLGIQGLRRFGLRFDRRHLQASQDRRNRARGGRTGREEPAAISIAAKLTTRCCRPCARPDHRSGHRRGRDAADADPIRARHVRSAGARALGADSVFGESGAGARCARAACCAVLDRAVEERRRAAVVA